jgi:hypothetical protein
MRMVHLLLSFPQEAGAVLSSLVASLFTTTAEFSQERSAGRHPGCRQLAIFYTRGNLLSAISPDLALVGLLGLLLTGIGLIGNQARLDRLVWVVELDGILLVVGYRAGLGFLYLRGIGL